MAPTFTFPFFSSTATNINSNATPPSSPTRPPTQPTTLLPTPLRVFKRAPPPQNPPLSPLAPPPPSHASSPSPTRNLHPPHLYPNPSSSTPTLPPSPSPSTYHSALSLPLTTTTTSHTTSTPSLPSSTNTTPKTCTLCTTPLSPLQTYTFPRTAPAVMHKLYRLFPKMLEPTTPTDASGLPRRAPTPTFCGTCFEAIHAAPLPPPPFTSAPITLPIPPSCKACTRELQQFAYQERLRASSVGQNGRYPIRMRKRSTSRQRLLVGNRTHNDNGHDRDGIEGISSYDGPAIIRKFSQGSHRKSILNLKHARATGRRKVSLGMKYPPLPKWMIRPPPKQRRASFKKLPSSSLLADDEHGNQHDDQQQQQQKVVMDDAGVVDSKVRTPKWMEKLPGNHRSGWRKSSGKVVDHGALTKAGLDVGNKGIEGRFVSKGSGRGFLGGRLMVV
ncbi:hypothetical protein ACLMJK_008809 [Lecanora helva]